MKTPKINTIFKKNSPLEERLQTQIMWAKDEFRVQTLAEARQTEADAKEIRSQKRKERDAKVDICNNYEVFAIK
jgi:hypothetical protein